MVSYSAWAEASCHSLHLSSPFWLESPAIPIYQSRAAQDPFARPLPRSKTPSLSNQRQKWFLQGTQFRSMFVDNEYLL